MNRLIGFVAVVGTVVVTACAASDTPAAKPVIALVMKSLANEFFQTMEDGAREHQRRHSERYDLVATGIKDELDVARQIAVVEQMVARQVDAIVLAPADSKALVAAARRATEAGIVVVNIDNRLDRDALAERDLQVPFVGPDNRKGARAVGAFVAARLSPGAEVAIIEGAPTAINGIQRTQGFKEAVLEAGLTLVRSQPAHWETARANQVASAIISEHPALEAILCANDSMALGALAALRAAGRADEVMVAGFDNISAVRELVTAGDIIATADQHGDQLAVFGIEYALEMLESPGQELPDRETPVDLVTAETAS